MNKHEDLLIRLQALRRKPVDPDTAGRHLAAMAELTESGTPVVLRHRLKIVAAFAVGLLAGTSGLATAGALPHGAQEVAHRTLGAVGVKVPDGDRYQGQECGGEVKNHGQYVRSQPKENRAEAAGSRCGKPIQAGTGDPDGAADGKAAGCQGPPPWAGKGKPDKAAKAARKQACGDAGKDDEGKAPAAPEAGARKVAPEEPATVTTEPPTSDTTAPGTAATTEPTATTTTTAATTTTTGGEETTSTTAAGWDGATTTTALIRGSGPGS